MLAMLVELVLSELINYDPSYSEIRLINGLLDPEISAREVLSARSWKKIRKKEVSPTTNECQISGKGMFQSRIILGS